MSRIHKKVHVMVLTAILHMKYLQKRVLVLLTYFSPDLTFSFYKLCLLCMCFPKNIIFHLFLFCSKLLRTEFGSRRLVQSLASEEPRLITRRRGPSSAIYI